MFYEEYIEKPLDPKPRKPRRLWAVDITFIWRHAGSFVERTCALVAVVVPMPRHVHAVLHKGVLKGNLEVMGDVQISVRRSVEAGIHNKGPAAGGVLGYSRVF